MKDDSIAQRSSRQLFVSFGVAAGCLVTAGTAVALISPGYCHDTAPGVQDWTIALALAVGFFLWLPGALVGILDAEAPIRSRIAFATIALLELGVGTAIIAAFAHQTAHYYDCG